MTLEPMPIMDEEIIRDDYREEMCQDRRKRQGEDWRNPEEDDGEGDESEEVNE